MTNEHILAVWCSLLHCTKPSMTETTAILITLVAYKVLLLGIGWFAQRRTKNETDMYLGGRNMGGLVAAISASASSSSVWTLLGVSGMAYLNGMSALWLFPGCVGGFALNWFLLAPRLRRYSHQSGALTVTEILAGAEGQPGRRAVSILASVIILFSLLTYVASQFSGAGKSFESAFQSMDKTSAILLGSAIVVVYTIMGGFWAVSLTDTVQGLMMAATSLLLPLAALWQVGGFAPLLEGLQEVPVDNYQSLTKGLLPMAGIGMVLGFLGIGLGYPGQPHVVNRFMALRDEGSLRQGRIYAMSWAVLVYAGMILLGLCGRLLLQAPPDDSEQVFFVLVKMSFPPVVAGIMFAAVLSAIMSTADSQLLVAASTVSHDLGLKGRSDKSQLLGDRLVILGLSAAAVVTAIFAKDSIYDSVLSAWTALGAAFGPLLLWIMWRGPLRPWTTFSIMAVGFVSSVLTYHFQNKAMHGFDKNFLPYLLVFTLLLVLGRNKAPVSADSQ